MNAKVIQYIVRFLLGEEAVRAGLEKLVAYSSSTEEAKDCLVQIIPSSFFSLHVYGTPVGYPNLPLEECADIPILFGESRIERPGDTGPIRIYADIIASTFFLISRYEEIYRRHERDEHGRFLGRKSLPYKAGFIQRPIVEEYGRLLRGLLREAGADVPEPPTGFGHVNLTHDVDAPFEYHGFRSFVRALAKEHKGPREAFRLSTASAQRDRAYTFPRIIEWDRLARGQLGKDLADIIFFFKAYGGMSEDRPFYRLDSMSMQPLVDLAKKHKVLFGLHASYAAGISPERIKHELHEIRRTSGIRTIDINRHHYLAAREPEDMHALISYGIRHDYTMGYADIAGFRLGTCRPVRFIDANTRTLTDLWLHPLTMMDVTLSSPQYMGFEYEEARDYAHTLINATAEHHGELNLLWHNQSLSPDLDPWHVTLYREILRYTVSLNTRQKQHII